MRRLAVLGHPVAHSLSPLMQEAALAEAGLAGEWSYEAIDVAPEDLPGRLAAMPGEGFAGCNLTVPHKEAALALATEASERARQIGAANTLTFERGAGPGGSIEQKAEILADNTDAPGMIDAIGGPPRGQAALVLGAGGAGRAAVWALLGAGATVEMWNRTPERAREVCRSFEKGVATEPAEGAGAAASASLAPPESTGAPGPAEDPDAAAQRAPALAPPEPRAGDYDLIVNATAAGLAGEDPFAELPLDPAGFRAGQKVFDTVYGGGPSLLLAAASDCGADTVDGLELLVCQGAISFEIWTGISASRDAMRRAVRPA